MCIRYRSYDWTYDIWSELWKGFFFGILLMGIVAGCICLGKRSGKYPYVLGGVLLMELMLTLCLNRKYTRFFNDINEYDLRVCDYIADDGKPVSYLSDGSIPYIDLLQFAMRDRKIAVITPEDAEGITLEALLPEEGYIIAAPECGNVGEMEERYRKCFESKDFILFLTE
ncbi:MAG: hypothetical protein K2O15_15395 [Lachnospiraceae bacterium]|nr:hypothetical protein [Lachnospiraceae bacterium]